MSQRFLVEIDVDALEQAAFNTGVDIVRDTAEQRMYLTLDRVTFYAASPDVAVAS